MLGLAIGANAARRKQNDQSVPDYLVHGGSSEERSNPKKAVILSVKMVRWNLAVHPCQDKQLLSYVESQRTL